LVLDDGALKINYPDGAKENCPAGEFDLIGKINEFLARFETDTNSSKIISNGLFGYFTHEAVEHFETIRLKKSSDTTRKIPIMQYHVYRYIIAVDHFKNELYIFQNKPKGERENHGLERPVRPNPE